jgi:hypothetical protein
MKYFVSLIFIAFMSSSVLAQNKIAYEVSFTEPQAHYAEVIMNISGVKAAHIDLKMPVWTPGSYLIREFSKNVEGFKAYGSGAKELSFEKISKNTWRINTANSGIVKVTYRVYSFEISVRTSFVDESHAFLSPTGIFMYPDGQLNAASEITINPINHGLKYQPVWKSLVQSLTHFMLRISMCFMIHPLKLGIRMFLNLKLREYSMSLPCMVEETMTRRS